MGDDPGRKRSADNFEGLERRPVDVEVEPSPASSSDRFAWERRRYSLIARAMESQGLTPTAAAALIDPALGDLPFEIFERASSRTGLPGGLRPHFDLTWIVLCRAETDEEPLAAPVDERLTGEMLLAATRAYDPKFRTANVIAGHGGPAHVTGRFSPPIGTLRALEFDGHNLWGLARDNAMASLEWAVGMGAHARSIFVRPASEKDGQPPYVDHLALLWGEYPIQPNLPDLMSHFESRDDPPIELARSEGWHYVPLAQKEAPMPEKKKQDPVDALPEEQRGIARTVIDALRGMFVAAEPDADDKDASPKGDDAAPEAPKGDPDLVRAIQDLKAEVGSLRAELDDGKAEARKAAHAARCSRVDAVLEGLVRAFKIDPKEAKSWGANLKAEGLSDEHVDSALEALAGRPSNHSLARTVIDQGSDGSDPLEVQVIESPDGTYRADPERSLIFARAEKIAASRTAGKGEAAYHDELRRILTRGDSELSTNVH